MAHLETAACNFRDGDNFKVAIGTKFRISNSRLHTMAKVGVFNLQFELALIRRHCNALPA
jgi:hypothetical protein